MSLSRPTNNLLKLRFQQALHEQRWYSQQPQRLPLINGKSVFSEENRRRCMLALGNYSRDYCRIFKNVRTERNAAVLVPLCMFDGVPSVLFTLRSSNLFRHRGLVSFPGGIQDPGDRDMIATALRETEEELGISPNRVDIWGSFEPLPSIGAKIMVTPVIGYVDSLTLNGDVKINESEVESAFTQSLDSLCNPKNWAYTQYRLGPGFQSPIFFGSGHRIWGLTGRLLHVALKGLLPDYYTRDMKPNKLQY